MTADRVLKRKRISDPNNASNYVDIPVIYQMKFRTIQERAQDRWIYFNNTSTSPRTIRVQRVHNNLDDSQYVDVERIIQLNIMDRVSQGQEYHYIVKNNDPPPIQPDGSNSPAHQKTHVVRYYKDNNTGSSLWVDVELIDEMNLRESSRAQEWIYFMKHPDLGAAVNDPDVPYEVTLGYCDPDLPLAVES